MNFWYHCQAEEIDDECCKRIQAALVKFHKHKSAIIDAKACVSKGNKPIDNWFIPKLKMMQSIIPNIQANGVPIQFSANVTEHAHITEIKNPAQAGNNWQYEAQICCDLDHTDKLRCFELATSIHNIHPASSDYDDSTLASQNTQDLSHEDDDNIPAPISLAQLINSSLQSPSNYFDEAIGLHTDPQALHPFHTFTDGCTAFHLNHNPSFRQMTITEAAEKFGLPDLGPALVDFMHHCAQSNSATYSIGGQCSTTAHANISFPKISVWTGIHIQSTSFHNADKILPLQLVNASPPCEDWPLGLYNTVIVNTDRSKSWPQSGLNGSWFTISATEMG